MKHNVTLYIILFLFKPVLSMQPKPSSLNKGKNLQRWAQLYRIQAQMETNSNFQQRLFTRAQDFAHESKHHFETLPKRKKTKELATTQALIKKIKKSEKFVKQEYAYAAKQALLKKIVAQQLVKEATTLGSQLIQIKAKLNDQTTKRQRKKINEVVRLTMQEKNKLLDRAHNHYLDAVKLYISVYDLSEKQHYLDYAADIIQENIYKIELEKASNSNIFVIYDEQANLLKEIKERKKSSNKSS